MIRLRLKNLITPKVTSIVYLRCEKKYGGKMLQTLKKRKYDRNYIIANSNSKTSLCSKMMLKKKAMMLLFVLIVGISIAYACEMMAIIALDGKMMVSNAADPDQLLGAKNMFEYFKRLGHPGQETNGFGIAFYQNYNSHTSIGDIKTSPQPVENERRSATNIPNATQTFDNYNPQDTQIGIFQRNYLYETIRIVIAHKRVASSGSGTIPDPHPWVYRTADRSYSFTHNGTISNADKALFTYFYESPENSHLRDSEIDIIWNTGVNQGGRIDSGQFYAYLLMHIKYNDMDVLRGLHAGLSMIPNNSPQHNFIFTDGFDVYAYKNSNAHSLSYRYNPTRNLAMVTTSNGNTGTALPYLSPAFEGIMNNQLNNRDLVYIPAHGTPSVFFKFNTKFNPNESVTLKRQAREGWNWHGFPVFTPGDLILTLVDIGYQGASTVLQEGGAASKLNNIWLPTGGFTLDADQNTGMKIATPAVQVLLTGELQPIVPYDGWFTAGNEYWVTYNLASGQSLKIAFGDFFKYVKKVESENWIYVDLNRDSINGNGDSGDEDDDMDDGPGLRLPNWPGTIPIYESSDVLRPLEFGKTYVITMKSNIPPQQGFQWVDSRQPPRGALNLRSKEFTYNTTPTYEAIEIYGLEDIKKEIKEIGVFAKETCIGATLINPDHLIDDKYPAPTQVLIYSQGYKNQPLTIRVLQKSGMISELKVKIWTYDETTEKFYENGFVAGNVNYSFALITE